MSHPPHVIEWTTIVHIKLSAKGVTAIKNMTGVDVATEWVSLTYKMFHKMFPKMSIDEWACLTDHPFVSFFLQIPADATSTQLSSDAWEDD
jgi:hypothetical protein